VGECQFCDGGFRLNEPALKMLTVHAKFLILAHLALKGAIYGQGFYQKCPPDGQKSAISDKEIAIFELRKVLFPDKHLRELPRACFDAVRSASRI
jgi:hypothetical protein